MNQHPRIAELEAELAKLNKVCAMREGVIRARDQEVMKLKAKCGRLESEKAELQAILDGLAEEGDF